MSRRYPRKKQEDDLLGPTVLIVGIVLLVAYYSLSKVQKGVLVASLVLLLIAIVALVFVITREKQKKERTKLQALELIDVGNMSGTDFEKYVAEIMKSRGYSHVALTEYYDMGVDILAEKDGIRWGIQAKRYKSPVKIDAVRQVVAGLNKYYCSRSMVITNSTYTKPAIDLAKTNNCILINKDTLAHWIVTFQEGRDSSQPTQQSIPSPK